jgi:lipoprotein-releasing system permease protein
MFSHVERLLAFRYLRAKRDERLISVISWFSLTGIALGVATLIVVLSVMRGVRTEMTESIVGLEGHVTVMMRGAAMPHFDELTDLLKTQTGVKTALPVVQGQVMVSFHGAANGAMVTGLRAEDLSAKPLLTQKINGDLEAFKRGEGIIIGSRMAERMGVRVGDSITLISPEGRATPAGTVPRIKAYPVVATFSVGMFAYDNGLVVLPFQEAQVFFMLSDAEGIGRVNAIEVMGNNAADAPQLAKTISQTLGGDFRVYDWQTSNGGLIRAVLVQRNVMFLVLTMIIIVASFNIVASLIMLVREKSKDIAVLRTIGASKQMIMRVFMTTGLAIGSMGTLAGVALGLTISLNTKAIQAAIERATGAPMFADELYFLSSLPAEVNASEVAFVAGVALLLTFVATLYPARRAASLNPVEVFRYE